MSFVGEREGVEERERAEACLALELLVVKCDGPWVGMEVEVG